MTDNKNKDEIKKPRQVMVSFRAPLIVQRQLSALKESWGEDTTHTVHRTIAEAYQREVKKRK